MATNTIVLNAGTTTWTVPADWTDSNSFYFFGCGGNGADNPGGGTGGGGGGSGGYTSVAIAGLTPGASIATQIPVGGSGLPTKFNGTSYANAGGNTTTSSPGAAAIAISPGFRGSDGGSGNNGGAGGGGAPGINGTGGLGQDGDFDGTPGDGGQGGGVALVNGGLGGTVGSHNGDDGLTSPAFYSGSGGGGGFTGAPGLGGDGNSGNGGNAAGFGGGGGGAGGGGGGTPGTGGTSGDAGIIITYNPATGSGSPPANCQCCSTPVNNPCCTGTPAKLYGSYSSMSGGNPFGIPNPIPLTFGSGGVWYSPWYSTSAGGGFKWCLLFVFSCDISGVWVIVNPAPGGSGTGGTALSGTCAPFSQNFGDLSYAGNAAVLNANPCDFITATGIGPGGTLHNFVVTP